MNRTPNLNLPYILPSQAQKHVTHNEAVKSLDAIVHLSVLDRDLQTPPAGPSDGDRYLVATGATGGWSGREEEIAAWQDGVWEFHAPASGWVAWIDDEDKLVVWDGSAWVAAGSTDGAFDTLSVGGAVADTTNRVSANSPATLLNHDGAGHQLKINKNAESDSATLVFQNGFSGRAEFGLAGEDHWRVKVSPDGATWMEVLVADKDTGELSLPAVGLTLDPSLFPNLLSDSGRFNGGTNQEELPSSAAVSPAYLSGYNGATLTFPAKFIHDNSTYGGAAGALDSIVDDLVVKIFGGGGLRYGPEFWCMNIAAGSGTTSPQTIGGDTYYLSTIVGANPRPVRYTSGFFLRCSVGKAAVPNPFAVPNTFTRDGSTAAYGSSDAVVTPSDGWVYFEMSNTRAIYSYDLMDLAIGLTSGGEAQFALPRVVAGWVEIGFNKNAVLTNSAIFGA